MQLPTPCNLLIIDTETNALTPKEGKVIELAAVLYSIDHQTTVQQMSSLFKATENPVEHINHIPPSILPTIQDSSKETAIKMFRAMADQADFCVAHNAEFDKQWFIKGAEEWLYSNKRGGPLPWLCTMSDFTWPKQSRPGEALVSLALHHGVGVSWAHRALTDCQLIANMLDRLEPAELNAMLIEALEPRYWYKAEVSIDDKDLAKQEGFRWYPDKRMWCRKLSLKQAHSMNFPLTQLPTSPN